MLLPRIVERIKLTIRDLCGNPSVMSFFQKNSKKTTRRPKELKGSSKGEQARRSRSIMFSLGGRSQSGLHPGQRNPQPGERMDGKGGKSVFVPNLSTHLRTQPEEKKKSGMLGLGS